MAGQLKVNGVTLATEESGTVTLEAPEIKDSSNNVILDQSGTNPVLKNVEVVNNSSMMFRNRIINGGMKISQRGTSFTFAHDGTSNGYNLDRFKIYLHNTDQYDCTVSQYSMSAAELNTTGHSNAFKLLTGTAESAIDNDEYVRFQYIPEAKDIQDFLHGTASAKTTTLSFWVKSSVTGDFGFNLYRYVSSGTARSINLSYTINSANTWEKKTISIVGDTGGATIPNDNTAGLLLIWQLAAGSNFYSSSSSSWTDYAGTRLMNSGKTDAVITTAGAEFYITGVQLEVGTVATQFEHRPYGVELSLCQRYYATSESGYQLAVDIQDASFPSTNFPVTMRTSPTATVYAANDATANTMSRFGGNKCNVSSVSTYPNGIRLIQHDSESEGQSWGYRWTADAEL